MNFKLEPTKDGKGFKIDARMMINRKSYRKRETFIGSKRQASRRGAEIVKELEEKAEKENPFRSLTIFGEAINYYRDRSGVKDKDRYCFRVLEEELGHVVIEDISTALDRFITYLSKSKTQHGKPYSASTLNRFQQWTRAIMNYAADWGVIEENPIKQIRRFKETPRDISISEEEKETLIATIQELRPYLLPITLYALQIPSRTSELVNLKREDVDMVNNLIRIKNGKTKNGQGVTKPIPPNLVEYFRSIPVSSEYAFYREDRGQYKWLGDFKKAWRTIRDAAGIKDLRFHDLRHYSATELVHKGLSEREVMQVAGWKTNMLSTYYHRDGFGAAKAVFSALDSDEYNSEYSFNPQKYLNGTTGGR